VLMGFLIHLIHKVRLRIDKMGKNIKRSIKFFFEIFFIATGKRLSEKNAHAMLEKKGLILPIACFCLGYFWLSTLFYWYSSLERRCIVNSIKRSQEINFFWLTRPVSVQWITQSASFVFIGNSRAFNRKWRFNLFKSLPEVKWMEYRQTE